MSNFHVATSVDFMKSWIVDNYDLYISKLEQFLIDYPVEEWEHSVWCNDFYETYSFRRI